MGEDYDLYGLFHFGFRLLLNRLFGTKLTPPRSDRKIFCSELVARWLTHVGEITAIEEFIELVPDAVSPSDLDRLLTASDLFEKVEPPCESLPSATST
jgi:hypothetical protein